MALLLCAAEGTATAYADSALFVSAENPRFENHFAGSMVVEVAVFDDSINEVGEDRGEPDVTVNGDALRMVQATDGNWYAYFASTDSAKAADQTSLDGGVAGRGLDFGAFCGEDTGAYVFGVSFSETDGISVPSSTGLAGFTNGKAGLSSCTGSLTAAGDNLNNVVRKAKPVNTNPAVAPGQIGLDPSAWPVIQLYSFGDKDDVAVRYDFGGGSKTVDLHYDEIPNVSLDMDRDVYPPSSEVFVTISDVQLNQDPTDEDSWTFAVGDTSAVFYSAFAGTGSMSGSGGGGGGGSDPRLVNLLPYLDGLGFHDNGLFSMSASSIVSLGTNHNQPSTFVSDGITTYSEIVTFAETRPNTGIFDTSDSGNDSVVEIIPDAPRGRADYIQYNGRSLPVLSGYSTASVATGPDGGDAATGADASISVPESWAPGTEIPITVFDDDQNVNSGLRDSLDLFSSTSIIPTIVIGSPATLESASDVRIYESSTDTLSAGTGIPSSTPDDGSARMFLDTRRAAVLTTFEKLSISLGMTASSLGDILIDGTGEMGTNWFNYDLRSLNRDLDLDDISDASISLYFGGLSDDTSRVVIADSGDLSQFQGLVQIKDADVDSILAQSGAAYLVINFDDSNDSVSVASISAGKGDVQPIVFDIFSFGLPREGNQDINNSIYRFELRETARDSGAFAGTVEYAVSNQLNIITPDLVNTLRPIGDDVKFVVTGRMSDEDGITISYSDISGVGILTPAAVKSSISTHSGTVSVDKQSYGFGRPVTITLTDPDLNLRHDRIDIYSVINSPDSENVDAVGGSGDELLLEVRIKGIKYGRCTIDGVEHGGLASSGFSLAETGADSGVFKGVFKMPSQICNEGGTGLVYTSGGTIDVRYFDFRDSSGKPDIVSLSRQPAMSDDERHYHRQLPMLNSHTFDLPVFPDSTDVVLSGSIAGHKRGVPVEVVLTLPNGQQQGFAMLPSGTGSYRGLFTLDSNSLPGDYTVDVYYQDVKIGENRFSLSAKIVTESSASASASSKEAGALLGWLDGGSPDQAYRDVVRSLLDSKYHRHENAANDDGPIPAWLKNHARYWIDGLVSDKEYLDGLEFLVKNGIISI